MKKIVYYLMICLMFAAVLMPSACRRQDRDNSTQPTVSGQTAGQEDEIFLLSFAKQLKRYENAKASDLSISVTSVETGAVVYGESFARPSFPVQFGFDLTVPPCSYRADAVAALEGDTASTSVVFDACQLNGKKLTLVVDTRQAFVVVGDVFNPAPPANIVRGEEIEAGCLANVKAPDIEDYPITITLAESNGKQAGKIVKEPGQGVNAVFPDPYPIAKKTATRIFTCTLTDALGSRHQSVFNVTRMNAPPVASNVAVSGTLQPGQLLTGTYVYSDQENDREGRSRYQWYLADQADGTNSAPIAGAKAKFYRVQATDVGKSLAFEVTPVAKSGSSIGAPVMSPWSNPVVLTPVIPTPEPTPESTPKPTPEPPANVAPSASGLNINGQLKVGKVVTGNYSYSDADGDAEGASRYQWSRADNNSGAGSVAISGATARTYTLQAADDGKYLRFEVIPVAVAGTNPGSIAHSAWSGPIGAENVAPSASALSISGPLNTGETLTGNYTYSDADGDAEGASSYQWYRAGNSSGTGSVAISGATADSYTLQAADDGKYMRFEVIPVAASGVNPGSAEQSAWNGPVVTLNSAPTASNVSFSGTLEIGETLFGDYDYSDADGDAEGTSTFTWYRADDAGGTNAAEIATTEDYTLANADNGKYIRFEVTPVASSGESPGSAAQSAWDGPVFSCTVTSNADTGIGSLRAVIDSSSCSEVTFDAGVTDIQLTSAQLLINDDMTIDGGSGVTIRGGAGLRVMEVSSGSTVTLDGLTIRDGNVAGRGGGIFNQGDLTIGVTTTITGNTSSWGGGGRHLLFWDTYCQWNSHE